MSSLPVQFFVMVWHKDEKILWNLVEAEMKVAVMNSTFKLLDRHVVAEIEK